MLLVIFNFVNKSHIDGNIEFQQETSFLYDFTHSNACTVPLLTYFIRYYTIVLQIKKKLNMFKHVFPPLKSPLKEKVIILPIIIWHTVYMSSKEAIGLSI